MNKDYLRRLLELMAVTFLGGALPVLMGSDFSKAALAGAASAGVAAVYGLLVKRVGDQDKPSVTK